MDYTLLVLILTEFICQYIGIFAVYSISTELKQTIGLLSSEASYVAFWLKAFVFVVQCERLGMRQSTKKAYFASGLFCQCGILFCLLTPSVAFVPLIPILGAFCFWPNNLISRCTVGVLCAFSLLLYSYQLLKNTEHASTSTQSKEWIMGLATYPGASQDLFPMQCECLVILFMGLFLEWPATLIPS